MPSKTDAELVRLAAEKVMGWKTVDKHGYLRECACGEPGAWSPLTNDGDSMMLVDKLATKDRRFQLFWDGQWEATFSVETPDSRPGDRAWTDYQASDALDRLRVLLLACLRAVGEDV